MKYLYVAAAVLAAVHAYLFGRYLITEDNKAGAYFAYFIGITSLIISVYRLVKSA